MILETALANALQKTLSDLYNITIDADPALVQPTRKEFEGDLTIVVFPYVKLARKAPDMVAKEIGEALCASVDLLSG